ncbi:MAG: sulfatase-like hydrolase/transferase [Candidatus Latescibacteria bacterium]|nr:sulfatase-like hydrolase/transferase [Candidatus Latescibacterota bacterium]
MSRPNIIYIVAHDLGRMLGCYGRGFHSPNLDRFARQGALFNRVYCTTTACSPSRGCAWTGQYAHTNGLMGLVNRGWSLPVYRRTIVDLMNEAGYHTGLVGLDHTRKFREDHRFAEYLPADPRTGVAVDNAIEFLRGRQDQTAPFYLNMGTIEVHGSQWGTHFANREEGGANPPLDRYGWTEPEKAPVPPTYKDAPQVRRELANYQACISYLDFHLGRLFNAIDRLGYRDNTLVMFNTDHGMEGLRGKGTLYELGMEIACMMRGPGIAGGTQVDNLIQNIDYVPTFLDAIGAAVPDDIQGQSFWPLLSGDSYEPKEMIFAERNWHGASNDPMRSVRTEKYHLIRNFDPSLKSAWTPETVPEIRPSFASYPSSLFPPGTEPRPEIELFDLEQDPYDWHNRADDPGLAPVKEDLLQSLDQWMRETDDPLLQGAIPDQLHPWPEAPTH